MNNLKHMKDAIDYIEEHLDKDIDYKKVAQVALSSEYHFQRMFAFIVGISLSEYVRRRRLTLAGFDLQNSREKILDLAIKYGYKSPDAFSRAFTAMHGILPSKARIKGTCLKAYPRIAVSISLKGVKEMNYRIEQKEAFSVVGIKKRFSYTDGLGENIGRMWAETSEEIMNKIASFGNEYVGVYSGMYEDHTTDYYIGTITSEKPPKELSQLDIASHTWAVFEITGPLPTAMAEIWGRIFSEWFPTSDYEHAEAPELEWYSKGDLSSVDYKSEIWIPVIKK